MKDPTSLMIRLTTTPGKINDLDDDKCIKGYWDGRKNEPMPGCNRSASYVQGWWAGMRDGGHRDYYPIDHDITQAWLENQKLCQ